MSEHNIGVASEGAFEPLAEQPRSPGRPSMYPYDEWFDGRVWTLKRGEHYTTVEETFRQTVSMAGRNRNLVVKTSADVVAGLVRIQAFEPVGASLRTHREVTGCKYGLSDEDRTAEAG